MMQLVLYNNRRLLASILVNKSEDALACVCIDF